LLKFAQRRSQADDVSHRNQLTRKNFSYHRTNHL